MGQVWTTQTSGQPWLYTPNHNSFPFKDFDLYFSSNIRHALYIHSIFCIKHAEHLEAKSPTNRPGKIWPEPIFWPEPEGKIWVWVEVFRPRNKDGVNPYPTRKMMGQVGSTRGSHGSTCFSNDFYLFIYLYIYFFFLESILLC